MKHIPFLFGAALLLSSCAAFQAGAAKVPEMAQCVLSDDWLSIGFTNPDQAKAWLRNLKDRLAATDPDAVRDAAELVARLLKCVDLGQNGANSSRNFVQL